MDTSIRKLLANAENYAVGEKNPALQQAYTLLRNVAETRPAVDAPDSFGQDLYVLCAEFAFQHGYPDMAKECLKMFFMKQPAANQFLCRAYLCQAQLMAPQNANNPEQLEKAVVYVLKAIAFAKESPRYHFLVYNASVIYWHFCRPFLKPGYRQYLARSLHQVVKALDDIEDKDYEWRAQLMIALIECHLDANRRNDASHIAAAAATFIKTNVPSLYKTVFGLMVRHQLVETAKLHKDLKTSPELAVFYKICKLKKRIDEAPPIVVPEVPLFQEVESLQKEDSEINNDLAEVNESGTGPLAESTAGREATPLNVTTPSPATPSRISPAPPLRISPAPERPEAKNTPLAEDIDEKDSLDSEDTRDYASEIRTILGQMGVANTKLSMGSKSQERLSRKDSNVKQSSGHSSSSSPREELEIDKKERYSKSPAKGRRTPTPTTSRKISADSLDKPLLLMELCRLCLELDLPEMAGSCIESMKLSAVKEPGFHLELEFVECELMIKSLADKQESYQKNVVDARLQVIKRSEEAIMNAIRLGDPNVIQAGCVTQWNLCLPLLQPNLRHKVRRPLTLVAEALENIESLLIQLRCQVHTELAHCEEDQEQIQVAMENLKKALSLDDGNVYQERLEVSLRRLELRAQLYKQPDRPEDQAAMIIEQARKADSGTMRMKRSLLVKAGEALAPDAFLLVLDSENDAKDISSGKGPLTKLRQLAGKAYQFNNCVKKAEGHLKRLGDENDRERARLWGDLAKTARKQEVWDVCRVACRFCLLYDDGRWKNVPPKRSESPKAERSRSDTLKEKEDADNEKKPGSRIGSRPSTPQIVPLYDKDLIRMMAEVTFINGEALVQLLRSENVQLNDKPVPPEDKSKRPKGYIAKKPEEDPDWIDYCEWIKDLSEQATNNFLRGLALGVELDESWVVCSAAAYIWNYNTHILSQDRHREIVPALTTAVIGMKKVGYAGETIMLINICNALAYGLIRPWMPEAVKDSESKSEAGESVVALAKGKGAKVPSVQPSKSKAAGVHISNDAMPDLKRALEVCDFGMQVTSGDNPKDVIPIFMRLPLLQTWVKAKQMAQQQISKQLGTDDEANNEGQRQMTRAIVAVEMLSLTKNGIMEFKDVPFIGDIAHMVSEAKWTDKFVELQLWTRLTYLAYEARLHNMVLRCSKKALRFAAHGTQPRTRKMDFHRYCVEQEMLSYASVLLGQSLIDNMKGKNSVRREAMEAFLNSAKYARSAGNYELVMTAARHFWNASIPLVSQPIERELLKEPLKILLECITATAEKAKKEEKPPEEAESDVFEEKEQDESMEKEKKNEKDSKGGEKKPEKLKKPEKQSGMIGKPEDDLTLRAAMYGVLFQSYADQGEWLQALEAIDQAVTDMPRTKHRLLIFKHRVMVKAKLGRSVHMDIQKFKDESEDFVAHMWRRVALNSKEATEQLASYQCAIEALENESNDYQKVEYLLEFGQWLYSNQFPLGDVQDQLEWASDILLNMKPTVEEEPAAAKTEGKKGKGKRPSEFDKRGSQAAKGKRESARQSVRSPDRIGSKLLRKDSARSKTSSVDRKFHLPPEADGGGSFRSKDSVASDRSSEINVKDYVPVVKVAEIGLLPNNPELTINDLTEIRQLDALIRSHVLLAEISGRESAQYMDILLMAHTFLMRLWEVLMSHSAASIREVVKNGGVVNKDEPAAAAAKPGKGSAPAPGKDKKDEKKKEEKPKPKRKSPVDSLPSDLDGWSQYDWPDEGIEAFKLDNLKNVAITQTNIPKPMLTLHYMDSLITQLRAVGYNHLTLPILAFQDLLSRTVLKNSALFKLVHLRSLEVCQELDLKPGTAHHLRIVGNMHICEEEQALSRDEIAQWKEKQIQVVQEEQRVREALARVTADSPTRTKAAATQTPPHPVLTGKGDGPEVELHLGKVLGSVAFRDVWTDTAEVLIRQGLYQRAREFLNEANIAAEAFTDKPLQARILFLLARLAYFEAQYGQAIILCHKAQEAKQGDEKFWFDTIVLLAKATIREAYNIQTVRKAKKILVYAINEFCKAGDENPNGRNVINFYCAKLETKLLKIHLKSILDSQKDVNIPKVLQAVLEGCERYESLAEQLINLQCRREAVRVIMKHAKLLRLLARQSVDKDLQRIYYSQTVNVMKQAASIAEKVYVDVHTLVSQPETKALNTPVQRELADVNIELGDLLIDILICRDKELRHQQLQEERKPSIRRLVEDYIREPPVYEDKEKQWIDLGSISGDEAAALFLSAHNMGLTTPRLKARSLVGLGHLLRVVSEFQGPDPPMQWMVHDIEILKMQLEAEEAEAEAAAAEAAAAAAAAAKAEEEEEEGENEGEDEDAAKDAEDGPDTNRTEEGKEGKLDMDEKTQKRRAQYTHEITTKKKRHEMSKFFYMVASECLAQALNHCLHNQFIDLAARASLEMVMLIGQYDHTAATMMLSLHQSCQTSLTLQKILLKSQPDPMTSTLAALLHQRRHMLKKDIRTNMGTSPFFKDVMHSLSTDWQAWKKLEITSNHLDLLKDFPSNYNLIILQHSPDRRYLYGAILDRPKGAAAGPKGKGHEKAVVEELRPSSPGAGMSRARIFGSYTDHSQLEEILSKFSSFKQQQQSMLLRREYQRTQAAMREKMLENLDEDQKGPSKAYVENSFEDTQLEEEFEEITGSMNAYLKSVLEPICHSLRSSNSALGSNRDLAPEGKEKERGSKDPQPQNECAILLVDSELMQLPLEANVSLQMIEGVNSVSRDFSLQLLYNRSLDDRHAEPEVKDAKGDGKKKVQKETSSTIMSRIPGLREAKQKQAKIIPLDRQPQAWQLAVNTHDFRYIVDPYLECAVTELNKPIKEFNKILEQHETQFTPRWLGVPGDEHTPSVGEWEIYLTESSSFIFYGMERLLAYIPPHKMSALNIPDCNILFSFDLAETSKSFQRQNKLDVLKTPTAISLESPVEMAMLASLTGIKCIVENQWHCSLAENAAKIEKSMLYLLQKGKTIGQVLHMLQNPIKVQEEEKASQKAAETTEKEPEPAKERRKSSVKGAGDVQKALQVNPPETEQGKSKDESKGADLPVVTRGIFNTVCYGMPNLIVNQ